MRVTRRATSHERRRKRFLSSMDGRQTERRHQPDSLAEPRPPLNSLPVPLVPRAAGRQHGATSRARSPAPHQVTARPATLGSPSKHTSHLATLPPVFTWGGHSMEATRPFPDTSRCTYHFTAVYHLSNEHVPDTHMALTATHHAKSQVTTEYQNANGQRAPHGETHPAATA